MQGLSHARLVSSWKELGEAEGMAEMWQAGLTRDIQGGFCISSFFFSALLVLIYGEDWNKSTEFWFGEVVGDHV